jgi:YbbR domain-containing protein
LRAVISPETVTVILSGPVALLDRLKVEDVRIVVDLANRTVGIYQIEPEVEVLLSELVVESILPENVEVSIVRGGTTTP